MSRGFLILSDAHCIMRIRRASPDSAESGMVLVLTLWILVILSMLLLGLFMSVHTSVKTVSAVKQVAEADAIGRGAVHSVTRELLRLHSEVKEKQNGQPSTAAEAENSLMSALIRGDELGFYLVEPQEWKAAKIRSDDYYSGTDWTGRNYAVCYVTAEDAKASVNNFKEANWRRITGLDDDALSSIMKLVKDRGGRLSCLEQLLALKEIRGKIYDESEDFCGLKNCLTVFSDGRICVNQASAAALSSTFDIDISKAVSLEGEVKKRRGFTDMAEFASASGADMQTIKKLATLTCQAYRIKVYAIIDGRAHSFDAVVVLNEDDSFVITYMGRV